MKSKGHLFISLVKSEIRVIGGIVTLVSGSIIPLAVGIIIAEVGGVLEELVDKRWGDYSTSSSTSSLLNEYSASHSGHMTSKPPSDNNPMRPQYLHWSSS